MNFVMARKGFWLLIVEFDQGFIVVLVFDISTDKNQLAMLAFILF